MSGARARRVVVAAVGSEFRRDDAAGPAVIDRVGGELGGVEVLGALASPFDLLGAWDGADLAIVVDAAAADDQPGAVHVVEVDMASVPETHGRTSRSASSHGVGVIEAIRIARVLGTAPERVVLVGVAGEDFGEGTRLSRSVSRAVEQAARVVGELAGAASAGNPLGLELRRQGHHRLTHDDPLQRGFDGWSGARPDPLHPEGTIGSSPESGCGRHCK
jgi:hydrogenase maturation protease